MKRRSPPWGAIEAFIAATRVASFKDAASQLGLSPAAFSRRIQALEAHIGVKLFDRGAPVPILTAAGERYLSRLLPGYEAMRAATDWMAPDPAQRPLRLAVSQSLATSWLVPRLSRFYEQVKGIDLVLQTSSSNNDLIGGAADVRILCGSGSWEHLVSEKLFDLDAFIVCAPRLANGRPAPRRVADLHDHRLLDLVNPPHYWDEWLSRADYCGPEIRDRIAFDSAQVMYEAAAQGLGLGLGVQPLVRPFLAEGRLQVAFDLTLPVTGAYYVTALPEIRRQRAVQTLWRWLADEAADGLNKRPRVDLAAA